MAAAMIMDGESHTGRRPAKRRRPSGSARAAAAAVAVRRRWPLFVCCCPALLLLLASSLPSPSSSAAAAASPPPSSSPTLLPTPAFASGRRRRMRAAASSSHYAPRASWAYAGRSGNKAAAPAENSALAMAAAASSSSSSSSSSGAPPLPTDTTRRPSSKAPSSSSGSEGSTSKRGGGSNNKRKPPIPKVSRSLPPHPSTSGQWRAMYNALLDYYARNGHCLVPKDYIHDSDGKKLGRWVARMRSEYKAWMKSKDSGGNGNSGGGGNKSKRYGMTPQRCAALDRLNFVWDLDAHNWDLRYSALVAYRKQHGHTNVPLRNDGNPRRSSQRREELGALGWWVRNQRKHYWHRANGRYSTMTDERLGRLKEVGFDFGMPYAEVEVAGGTGGGEDGAADLEDADGNTNDGGSGGPVVVTQTRWSRKFSQLIAFRSRFGHTNVPASPLRHPEHKSLGQWVASQRVQYRNIALNKKPQLSEERVEKLESIGFTWDLREERWGRMAGRLREVATTTEAETEEGEGEPSPGTVEGGGGGAATDSTASTASTTGGGEGDDKERLYVPLSDVPNRDLRTWLRAQRYNHALLHRNRTSALDRYPHRIPQLESIPGFEWTPRRGAPRKYDRSNGEGGGAESLLGGRTVGDWERLFDEVRDRGIEKPAWAAMVEGDGLSDEQDYGTGVGEGKGVEEDLADLWNMEGDDDDDDDDDWDD